MQSGPHPDPQGLMSKDFSHHLFVFALPRAQMGVQIIGILSYMIIAQALCDTLDKLSFLSDEVNACTKLHLHQTAGLIFPSLYQHY